MKLYSLRYSPYARKVEMLLDLLGRPYERIEMQYSDRSELATLTGGYVLVPVLVDDAGKVIVESRDICERLLNGGDAARLVPSPLQGPIWAYADFVDGPLEDVLFRIASPTVRDHWKSPSDRALYTLIKERKFGPGCLETWLRERDTLIARGQRLLAPTLATLAEQPFLFGRQPTLADAALYGCCAMLKEADPTLLTRLSPALPSFMERVEAQKRR
ncbi:MAG TPA: glutathione S-transferase family protein [Polyangiaceae bacterium]|nr:glutathione S-transferase family protein [Polyangiaceae bacterium]